MRARRRAGGVEQRGERAGLRRGLDRGERARDLALVAGLKGGKIGKRARAR